MVRRLRDPRPNRNESTTVNDVTKFFTTPFNSNRRTAPNVGGDFDRASEKNTRKKDGSLGNGEINEGNKRNLAKPSGINQKHYYQTLSNAQISLAGDYEEDTAERNGTQNQASKTKKKGNNEIIAGEDQEDMSLRDMITSNREVGNDKEKGKRRNNSYSSGSGSSSGNSSSSLSLSDNSATGLESIAKTQKVSNINFDLVKSINRRAALETTDDTYSGELAGTTNISTTKRDSSDNNLTDLENYDKNHQPIAATSFIEDSVDNAREQRAAGRKTVISENIRLSVLQDHLSTNKKKLNHDPKIIRGPAADKTIVSSNIIKSLGKSSAGIAISRIRPASATDRATIKRRSSISRERELRYIQNSTHFLISRSSFTRLVKEIINDNVKLNLLRRKRISYNKDNYYGRYEPDENDKLRITVSAVDALQVAAEEFLIELMTQGNLCAFHAKRVTLMKKDLLLVIKIRKLDLNS